MIRLGRIDAAIDAMLPFGFTVKQVRKCVKELLKEYGGDDGWPFIEDASYNELVSAILRDVEKDNQEEIAQDGNLIVQDQNLLKDKSNGKEEPTVTDNRVSDTLQDERSPANTVAVAEPVLDGKGWKVILPDQTSAHVEETKNNNEEPPTKVDSLIIKTAFAALPPRAKRRKCTPCYGWIEDDEEEDGDDFITLQPSSMMLGPPPIAAPPRGCLGVYLP
ncbi:hypothetical protein ACS0TY_000976 [Phlomoides rotata]